MGATLVSPSEPQGTLAPEQALYRPIELALAVLTLLALALSTGLVQDLVQLVVLVSYFVSDR